MCGITSAVLYKHSIVIAYITMAGAKGRVNHQQPLVRMTILIGQRDHIWCVVCAEEDGLHKPGMSTNEKLIIVVVG